MLWVEERPAYAPRNAASKKLLSDGWAAVTRLVPDGGVPVPPPPNRAAHPVRPPVMMA